MLTVEPRPLLAKLNAVCTRSLEAAASACIAARHYEVTVEHVLVALLDDATADVRVILQNYGVEPDAVRAVFQRYVSELRSGNAGKPVFSSLLLEWIQDGWLYASTELGEARVRSGALLVRLLLTGSRYTPLDVEAFERVPAEALRRSLKTVAGSSAEAQGPELSSDSAAPGGRTKMGDGALDRFTLDLTERARAQALDPVFGREHEIRQVIEILVRKRKNNPIIIGEAGVGKTALVEGLALRIAEGSVPDQLKKVRLLTLDLGALQAGASMRGEFENRLKSVIDEVRASPQPVVLFIDEAHTIIGAGGPQGGGDAANLLKPALARGELRTIAATTYAEFKRYFEKDAALERRFQPVRVDEPSEDVAILMLRGLAARFEQAHGVVIRDEAVEAAVKLSSRYVSGRQLPDKAVDVLDTSAAYVNLLRAAPPAAVEDLRASVAAVERLLAAQDRDQAAGVHVDEEKRKAAKARREELAGTLATLEQRLAEQRTIVGRIDELRRVTERDDGHREKLGAALGELRAIPTPDRLVAADVDESAVASIISDWTGVPLGRMVADDLGAVLKLPDRLKQRVRGQDGGIDLLCRELSAAKAGLKPPSIPLGVFLLVGPSGVGKTETALGLADFLFGGERFMVTINMSEFQERHTVSRLIGSPPGYVGFGEGGVLTEAVRHRPYSVVLLDEVEKADREVMNLFYQVFDKGTLSDGEGRVIDFKNTVIVLTSNLATDLITEAAHPEKPLPAYEELVELVKPTLSAYFKPALLARMSVVPYVPIRADVLGDIARYKLDAVVRRALDTHGVKLEIDSGVIEAIVSRCREVEAGARNIDHILRGSVLPEVSRSILQALVSEQPLTRLELRVASDGRFECSPGGAA